MDERQFIELFMKSIAEDDNSPLNPDADAPSTSASTFEKTVITEGSGTASPERGARITGTLLERYFGENLCDSPHLFTQQG